MAKPTKRQSPYQKYGKRPYQYAFKRCAHARSHVEVYSALIDRDIQSFRVEACDVCHIVTSGPFRRASERRSA